MKETNKSINKQFTTKQIGQEDKKKSLKSLKTRSIIAFVTAFALLLGGTAAYFTDYVAETTVGTAGTVQIAVEDNINLLNADGKDILNPGDARPVNFTIINEGNKSVDTQVVIKLTSSVPMSDRLSGGSDGSLELEDEIGLILGEGDPAESLYDGDVYSSEYELYWAKDIVAVEGYGHYPKYGEDEEMVYPVLQRYINAAKTQIVYVLDGGVLSGNSSLAEQETEYRKAVDMSNYSFDLIDCMYGWYEGNDTYFACVDVYEGEINNDLIYVIYDRVYTYNEDETYGYYPINILDISNTIDVGIKHIAVSKNVSQFVYSEYDSVNDEYIKQNYTKSEIEAAYGIEIEYYDDYKGFTDPTYASIISAEEYAALSDEEKAACTAVSDNKTYDLILLFDPNTGNKFQNSSVSIQVEIQAKQHRNTEGNWEMVAKMVDASIDTSVFTVEYDKFGRVALTGVQDGIDFESLTNVVIPEGVEVIPESFFAYHENLESVILPSTIKEIGVVAFENCPKLSNINLPEGIEYLGFDAFRDCTSLTYIEIPQILVVGSSVFNGSGLETVVVKEGNTTISYGMFQDCTKLSSIVLPDTITEIQTYAFYGCTNLKSIAIPDSVESIGYNAFYCRSSVDTTVYTNNNIVKNYNWSKNKRNVTILPYEDYDE